MSSWRRILRACWRRNTGAPDRPCPIRCPTIRSRCSGRGSTRPADARIAAAASAQSQPLAARADLLARIAALTRSANGPIPRPPRWGGYRVWAERVELWVGQPARAHDRARWTRPLTPIDGAFKGGAWSATRLMP
jgi:pyridoxamine 5'-phosphate oxidase